MNAISRRTLLSALTLAAATLAAAARPARAGAVQQVVFHAADGVSVYGRSLPARGASRGIILLFHMAGASAAEYAPIQPRLSALGYDSLAIDQRSGGGAFGGVNLTADQFTDDPGYAATMLDLEAALSEGIDDPPGGGAIVWGSSYSAGLVFLLAARHPAMIRALFAFSPGEFIEGVSVRDAAAQVECPVFVTAAPGEAAEAGPIFDAVPGPHKRFYRPHAGVHGASTLRADRNPAGAAANWKATVAFLSTV